MGLFDVFDGSSAVEQQSLDQMSPDKGEQDFFVEKADELSKTKLRVDYSDFSNFICFNSALDYFNISGEKILNDYPYDGSRADIIRYVKSLDGYQQYLLEKKWPKNTGRLGLNGDAYAVIDDVGKDNESSVVGILNPGTGSFTVEGWLKPTGTYDTYAASWPVFDKGKPTGDGGLSIFLSNSESPDAKLWLSFRIMSGSTSKHVSASFCWGDGTTNEQKYFACTYDKADTQMRIYTGSLTSYPVLVVTGNVVFYDLNFGSGSLYVGSNTSSLSVYAPIYNAGDGVRNYVGEIDELRYWKKSLSLNEISSSFNTRAYAQDDLYGLWHFNETGSIGSAADALVLDSSGHKLDGLIRSYVSALRLSGSTIYDVPDYVLDVGTPEVHALIIEQQASGSDYDRQNRNIITNFMPESVVKLETIIGTEVAKNFLYVLARNFDQIKLHVDQFVNLLKVGYGDYDDAPDSLLKDVAEFFGWQLPETYVSTSAIQYFIGKNVNKGFQSNEEMSGKLHQIKNEIWRRTLANLMHLYKTKGTKESVDTLVRSHGLDTSYVRLKEYGKRYYGGVKTTRTHAQKSAYAFRFGSGSNIPAATSSLLFTEADPQRPGDTYTYETRVRFPLSTTEDLQPSFTTGSLLCRYSGSHYTGPDRYYHRHISLLYAKNSIDSVTGTLFLTSSDHNSIYDASFVPVFSLQLTGTFFDGDWYNVAFSRDNSGSFKLSARKIENGELVYRASVTSSCYDFYRNYVTTSNAVWTQYPSLYVGAGAITSSVVTVPSDFQRNSQCYQHEVSVWGKALSDWELDDHALNFQSYGESSPLTRELVAKWRMDEDYVYNLAGDSVSPTISDLVSGSIFSTASLATYDDGYHFSKKFLMDYAYIVPPGQISDDDKINVHSSFDPPDESEKDSSSIISLELNMVDALNEDIAQLMSSLDPLDDALGLPANRYREEYTELEKLRREYFRRLQGGLNFKFFIDLLEFYDLSFMKLVQKLVPARASYVGESIVVESHMLERPKVVYRRLPLSAGAYGIKDETMEGRLRPLLRFGHSTGSLNG